MNGPSLRPRLPALRFTSRDHAFVRPETLPHPTRNSIVPNFNGTQIPWRNVRMMIRLLATTAIISAVTLAAATTVFAKGHDQGFGAQLAGKATAGAVDEGQSNRDDSTFGGNGSETAYGKRDASVEAKLGEQDNSEVARDRASATHPSN
jgi:hypothetical protein